jgi:hypothetical protein
MTSIASIPLDNLTQRCVEETEKFNRRAPNDPQFCFELLRRALAEGISEAFTRVYQVYERQALHWVYSHSRYEQTGESADFFARSALSNFYFALRGAKFERFAELPQVLAYLKLCVHTAIIQYLRDQRPSATTPLDDASEVAHTPDLGTRADAAELWAHIERLLPDARDRLLARCVFILDLKPRQIVAAYPARWRDEREVSVDLFRLRRKLRSDAELRRRVGLAPDEPAGERSV